MPYYCTVPRCTSMAGKAENVSFHQFPRDEELAKLWNKILKRGKPYTKYSKVCSLHFKPEDYTITSVGKNKGQWRTLRKDAIPSQNLPSDTPAPSHHRPRNSGAWVPSNLAPNAIDSRMQQHVAQAIYMQTMLAMQAATNGSNPTPPQSLNTADSPQTSTITLSDIEQLLQKSKSTRNGVDENLDLDQDQGKELTSYKCLECFKCFKDPDVFMLHKRCHVQSVPESLQAKLNSEKENLSSNSEFAKQDTLRANPILANLLKSGITPVNELRDKGVFDINNVLSIENQIMTALTTNMEAYIRNLSSMLHQTPQVSENGQNSGHSEQNSENGQHSGHSDQNSEDSHHSGENDDSMDAQNHVRSANFAQEYDNFLENVHNSTQDVENLVAYDQNSTQDVENLVANDQNSTQDVENLVTNVQNSTEDVQNLVAFDEKFTAIQNSDEEKPTKVDREPNCDNQDLNDSNNLVIDETV